MERPPQTWIEPRLPASVTAIRPDLPSWPALGWFTAHPPAERRTSGGTRSLHWHGSTLEIAPGYEIPLQRAGLDNLTALVECTGPIVSAGSHRTTRRIELRGDRGPIGVYVKQYRAPRWRVRYFARRSKLLVERQNSERLRAIGVRTPDWIAVGERRVCGFLREAVLVVRELEGAATLDRFALDQLPAVTAPTRTRAVRELTETLLEPFRHAHTLGYLDRDLHWRNILLRRTAGELTSFWIDSPNGIWLPHLPWPFGLKDLADLDKHAPGVFTRTERLRFFLRYSGRRRLTPFDRWLIRRLVAKNGQRRG